MNWGYIAVLAAASILAGFFHWKAAQLQRSAKPFDQRPEQSSPGSETDPQNNNLSLATGFPSWMRTPTGSAGGARLLSTTTAGCGEQELKLGMHPTKILFEESRSIVDESGFGTKIEMDGKAVTIRRFTDQGVVVDDHGARVGVRIYVLDGSPGAPSPTQIGKEQQYADLAVTVLKVTADPRPEPNPWDWKCKVRAILRNNTDYQITLKKPEWKAGDVPLQPDIRFGYSYQRPESPNSWKEDSWNKEEFTTIALNPGEVARVWIGLDPWFTEQEIQRHIEAQRLGTLILPVTTVGKELMIARKV